MYVLHSQAEQRKQHDYGFLLVPGYVVDYGQLVYVVQPEHFLQLQRYHCQRIAVVALPCVEHAGNAVYIAQRQLVVAVFSAAGGEYHGVVRQHSGKARVVFASAHTPVAAGHDDEFPYCSALYGFNHLVGQLQHLVVGKSARYRPAFYPDGRQAACGRLYYG